MNPRDESRVVVKFCIIKLVKLNKDQKKLTAEILGNVSVAWFASGVISPFFLRNLGAFDILRSFFLGLFLFLLFFFIAIYLLKK